MDGIRTSLKCKNLGCLEEVGTRSPPHLLSHSHRPARTPGEGCPFFQAAVRPKPLAPPPQALARLGSAHR